MKKTTVKERLSTTAENFKAFAFKGSAIDIAIGMMVGAATTAVVNSLIKDIINFYTEDNKNLFIGSNYMYKLLDIIKNDDYSILKYILKD